MEIELPYKIDAHRRLCIKKDLIALSHWMDAITAINIEIDYLKIIGQQLIKDHSVPAPSSRFQCKVHNRMPGSSAPASRQ